MFRNSVYWRTFSDGNNFVSQKLFHDHLLSFFMGIRNVKVSLLLDAGNNFYWWLILFGWQYRMFHRILCTKFTGLSNIRALLLHCTITHHRSTAPKFHWPILQRISNVFFFPLYRITHQKNRSFINFWIIFSRSTALMRPASFSIYLSMWTSTGLLFVVSHCSCKIVLQSAFLHRDSHWELPRCRVRKSLVHEVLIINNMSRQPNKYYYIRILTFTAPCVFKISNYCFLWHTLFFIFNNISLPFNAILINDSFVTTV